MSNDIRYEDGRNMYQKLSRSQIRKCLEAADIKLSNNQNLIDGIQMLQSKGFDPRTVVNFNPVNVKRPDGTYEIKEYPESTEPVYSQEYETRRDSVMAQRLEDAEKEAEKDKEEISELKAQVAKMSEQMKNMMDIITTQREELQSSAVTEAESKPLEERSLEELRQYADERGIKYHHLAKESKMIETIKAALNG